MRYFKLILILVCFNFSALGQDDNDWLQQSMKKSEQYVDDLKKAGLLERHVNPEMLPQVQQYLEEANEISKKSYSNEIYKSEFTSNYTLPDQPIVSKAPDSSSYIFVSFAMTDAELRSAFQVAEKEGAELLFRGMHPDDLNITDTMVRIRRIMKGLDISPSAKFNSKAFDEFRITAVPYLFYATKEQIGMAGGVLSFDWLRDNLSGSGFQSLGVVGPTKSVIEKPFLQEIKERFARIDGKRKKEEAIARFWHKQAFTHLPETENPKIFYIDPTVEVQSDISNPDGVVLAYAGDRVNPLETAVVKQTYFIIDPLKTDHLEWVRTQIATLDDFQQYKVLVTRLDRTDGWKKLSQLRTLFSREIYLLPSVMAERFHISSVPAVVSTDIEKKMLKVSLVKLSEEYPDES
tara:strand:- start:9452 stop:10666 length:1215 start_codon:yes stop_codon:yes gene_type:complete